MVSSGDVTVNAIKAKKKYLSPQYSRIPRVHRLGAFVLLVRATWR